MNKVLEGVLRIVLPQDNACLLCGRSLWGGEHLICEPCAHRLEGLKIPPEDQKCPSLPAEYCMNVFYHSGEAAKLVYLLKYNQVPIAAEILGGEMAKAAEEIQGSVDMVVPVPVHAKRLRERGYNQAGKLADCIGDALSLPVRPEGMTRTDEGRSLVGLSRAERMQRKENPFAAEVSVVMGRNILLVDDVYTTGRTVSQCAEALKLASCGKIWALTACRA